MQSVGHLDSRESTPNAKIVTLLVRHLPEAIPVETLSRLFSHYGAISVRPCADGRLRNCAYVDFNREELASQAQSQLNRLRFLGKVMSVERALQPNTNGKDQLSKADAGKNSINPSTSLLEDGFSHENQSKGTTQTLVSVEEPIAPRLGVDYPFPPHLKYAYPPPDGNILTNIVNALIAVPQFYTQVLHLMNKMNIPAPFCMALPTPPLPSSAPAQPPSPPPPPPPIPNDSPSKDMSTDESELESSEDGDYSDPKTSLPPRKRPKRKAIIGPGVDKAIAHEAVGLKSATLVPKELPLIKKNIPVLQIKISSKSLQNESLDGENCLKEPPMSEKETVEIKPYALPQEIESGKLPAEEFLSLPIVKNYAAGNPATVLYIKNLAKDVIVDDFYYIFGSLFGNLEAARSNLTVKLMQEGRMRGQAFITFPSIDLASHALNLVNGYVFKGKPIIIQFGRNPKSDKIN